jgi:hypothetical protein
LPCAATGAITFKSCSVPADADHRTLPVTAATSTVSIMNVGQQVVVTAVSAGSSSLCWSSGNDQAGPAVRGHRQHRLLRRCCGLT